MPTQQLIRFIARTSWEGQRNGLPEFLYSYMIFDQYDRAIFDKVIEQNFQNFGLTQLFPTDADTDRIIDIREVPAGRRSIPLKWIVEITVSIHALGAEMSQADENGKELMSDGSEPVKQ